MTERLVVYEGDTPAPAGFSPHVALGDDAPMGPAPQHRQRLIEALRAGRERHGMLAHLNLGGQAAEDMETIGAQLEGAWSTALEIEAELSERGSDARADVLRLIHKLNNQLTGALSITMLVRQELNEDSVLENLSLLEEESRRASAAARDIALDLRA